MRPSHLRFAGQCLAIALIVSCSPRVAAAPAPSAPPPSAAAAAKAAGPEEIAKSVFNEGRNPFFPYAPQPTPIKPGTVVPDIFILNGITSPPKRTAMINGRTFEVGESGEVRAGGGKVLIKCEEIGNDSAVISIDGQRRVLRLRFGL